MATYEATKYNFSSDSLTGSLIVATGTIVPWTVSSAPTGYLECDGAAVSRSTYSALFAVIGTTYGSGDGSSTFTLPDLKDRVVYGKSGTVSLASTGGAATVTPSGTNAGTALSESQLPAHNHTTTVTFTNGTTSLSSSTRLAGGGATTLGTQTYDTDNTGSGATHTHTFSGDAQSTLQPYLCLKFMIKI